MLEKREGLVSPEVLEMFRVAISRGLGGSQWHKWLARPVRAAGACTSGQFQWHL